MMISEIGNPRPSAERRLIHRSLRMDTGTNIPMNMKADTIIFASHVRIKIYPSSYLQKPGFLRIRHGMHSYFRKRTF